MSWGSKGLEPLLEPARQIPDATRGPGGPIDILASIPPHTIPRIYSEAPNKTYMAPIKTYMIHASPLRSSYCWPCPLTPTPAPHAALPEDAVQGEGAGLSDARRPCTTVHPHPRFHTTVPLGSRVEQGMRRARRCMAVYL